MRDCRTWTSFLEVFSGLLHLICLVYTEERFTGKQASVKLWLALVLGHEVFKMGIY